MNQGMSVKDLFAETVRLAQMKRDHYIDARDVRWVRTGGGLMVALGDLGTYLPNRYAERQMLQDLRDEYKRQTGVSLDFGSGYWDNLKREDLLEDGNLFAPQVNHWLSKNKGRKLVRTYANADGDDILRAWLSNGYRILDYDDMLEAVMPDLLAMMESGDLKFVSTMITESKIYLKALLPKFTKEVKYAPGHARMHEVVDFGFEIGTSEIGQSNLYARALSVVQWCSNTAVHDEYSKKVRHAGARVEEDESEYSEETRRLRNAATLSEFRDVVRNAMNEATANAIRDKMQTAVGVPVENVGHAVETLKNKWNLTEKQHDSILYYFSSGTWGNSLFGLSSAVTRAAEDETNYDEASAMEERGGSLLNLTRPQIKEIVTV